MWHFFSTYRSEGVTRLSVREMDEHPVTYFCWHRPNVTSMWLRVFQSVLLLHIPGFLWVADLVIKLSSFISHKFEISDVLFLSHEMLSLLKQLQYISNMSHREAVSYIKSISYTVSHVCCVWTSWLSLISMNCQLLCHDTNRSVSKSTDHKYDSE